MASTLPTRAQFLAQYARLLRTIKKVPDTTRRAQMWDETRREVRQHVQEVSNPFFSFVVSVLCGDRVIRPIRRRSISCGRRWTPRYNSSNEWRFQEEPIPWKERLAHTQVLIIDCWFDPSYHSHETVKDGNVVKAEDTSDEVKSIGKVIWSALGPLELIVIVDILLKAARDWDWRDPVALQRHNQLLRRQYFGRDPPKIKEMFWNVIITHTIECTYKTNYHYHYTNWIILRDQRNS